MVPDNNRTIYFKPKLAKTSGFTLIEMLVVMAIIGLISSVVVANINYGNQTISLKNVGHELVIAARQAQNLTLSGAVGPNGKVPEQGYSLKIFSQDDIFYPNSFATFAEYNSGPVLLGDYQTLPADIKVGSPIANSFWQIKFLPLSQGIVLVNSVILSEMSVPLTN